MSPDGRFVCDMRFSRGLRGVPAAACMGTPGPGVAWLIPRPGVVENVWKPFALVGGFLLLVALLLGIVIGTHAQVAHRAKPSARTCQLQAATARLHVREATGRNDGPEVEAAQKAAGAKKYDPWCGCEMYVQQVSCRRMYSRRTAGRCTAHGCANAYSIRSGKASTASGKSELQQRNCGMQRKFCRDVQQMSCRDTAKGLPRCTEHH